ncbi:hypothetical protein [Bacillus atrophaeus]|uniref:hypothetical protein n=1 Tax=Bacillus atrophaeus TaxID=1452 RepID=UPI00077AABAD|nr:hypothetical protein [Bacillus atrophaeus]KXZ12907.1 hypothetical protein AXI57_17010 [Bacillus atrophaeus]MED4809510.1 hypothetical protein [Bacillus atrophaeus]GED03043.1 hypothetical protein BAT02nite_26870 [Bacillus atrophaeus]
MNTIELRTSDSMVEPVSLKPHKMLQATGIFSFAIASVFGGSATVPQINVNKTIVQESIVDTNVKGKSTDSGNYNENFSINYNSGISLNPEIKTVSSISSNKSILEGEIMAQKYDFENIEEVIVGPDIKAKPYETFDLIDDISFTTGSSPSLDFSKVEEVEVSDLIKAKPYEIFDV